MSCNCDACQKTEVYKQERAKVFLEALATASEVSGVDSETLRQRGIQGSPALVTLFGDKAVRIGQDYNSIELFKPLLDPAVWPKLKYLPRVFYGKRVGDYNVTVMDRYIVSPHLGYENDMSARNYPEIAKIYPDLMPDVYALEKEVGQEAFRLKLPIPDDLHWYNYGWTKDGQIKLIDFWQ